MAQLTKLNTRIRLRYDELANWNTENPVLYKGEIAVVSVPVDHSASTGLQETKPAILFKVGDGESTFSQLPWGSALAADVYAWAKVDHAPTATEIKMATNNNTTVSSEISGLQAQINALTGNEGEGTSIANLITAAIEALDGGNDTGSAGEGKYVSAVTQEDGLVSVVYSDLPAEFDDSDLWTAIEAIYKAGENGGAAAGVVAGIDGRVATLEGNAQTQGSVDYKIAQAISALNLGTTYAGKAYETKVDTLIGSDTDKSVRTIANEELAAQLIPENADEALNSLQEIAAWIQEHPGDAATMNAAIQALKTHVGLIDSGASRLTKTVDVEGTPTVQQATVKEYVDNSITALGIGNYALDADLDTLAGRVTTAEGDIDTLEGRMDTAEGDIDTLEGRMDTAEGDIDALETAIGNMDYNVAATEIAQANQNEEEYVNVLTGFQVADGQLVSNSIDEVTLAKVATTGSINDLIQDLVLELDGGNAAGSPSDPLVPTQEP